MGYRTPLICRAAFSIFQVLCIVRGEARSRSGSSIERVRIAAPEECRCTHASIRESKFNENLLFWRGSAPQAAGRGTPLREQRGVSRGPPARRESRAGGGGHRTAVGDQCIRWQERLTVVAQRAGEIRGGTLQWRGARRGVHTAFQPGLSLKKDRRSSLRHRIFANRSISVAQPAPGTGAGCSRASGNP
jgi:hypothetical protein